jgi:hypothetical protein
MQEQRARNQVGIFHQWKKFSTDEDTQRKPLLQQYKHQPLRNKPETSCFANYQIDA